jgi:hypothetical protein
MNVGQSRPVEHLLGQPVLPLRMRVGHVRQAHLRDGHLRHIHEHFQVASLARFCGGALPESDCCHDPELIVSVAAAEALITTDG